MATDKTPEQSPSQSPSQSDGTPQLEPAMQECPQCSTDSEVQQTSASLDANVQATACQPVVAISEYLGQRIQVTSYEIKDVEQTTSVLMNQLIREKDHAIARRLQKEIGRLDTSHAQLEARLRTEKKRQQLYLP